jgi:hypothetical protein
MFAARYAFLRMVLGIAAVLVLVWAFTGSVSISHAVTALLSWLMGERVAARRVY